MSLANTAPRTEVVEISVENVKSAVRELLNRYRLIDDNKDWITAMEFGDIRTEASGNEIVPITLTYGNQGGDNIKDNG